MRAMMKQGSHARKGERNPVMDDSDEVEATCKKRVCDGEMESGSEKKRKRMRE